MLVFIMVEAGGSNDPEKTLDFPFFLCYCHASQMSKVDSPAGQVITPCSLYAADTGGYNP